MRNFFVVVLLIVSLSHAISISSSFSGGRSYSGGSYSVSCYVKCTDDVLTLSSSIYSNIGTGEGVEYKTFSYPNCSQVASSIMASISFSGTPTGCKPVSEDGDCICDSPSGSSSNQTKNLYYANAVAYHGCSAYTLLLVDVSGSGTCNFDFSGYCSTPGISSELCLPSSSSSASSSSSSSDAGSSSSSEEEKSSSSSDNYSSSSSSEESSSSSSEDEESSSSSEDDDSSSSSEGCYPTFAEAAAVYDDNIWQCARVGDIPNFTIDIFGCIGGECIPRSSSSSASSSSSSGGGNGTCAVASKSFLKKESDIYDDWVYIGKETYGSKVVTSSSLKPGSKFFDVLGRVYDKMKAKIQYYVRPDTIKRDARDVPMEFEVWGRIIKDEDGNDIRMFIKEDKRNGLRKDSSFYFDGYWEVFEFNDAIGETVFKAASGIKSISRYDDKERLKEYYRMDVNGDTLESQKYEWKNGRLIRMTANGVVRKYIYGRTLQDMVRVEPSDEGFNYHRGYNGTVEKIPEEGTPEYEIFSLNPYGNVYFGEAEGGNHPEANLTLKKNSGGHSSGKSYALGCIKTTDRIPGMPEPLCVTFIESGIRKNSETALFGYPHQNELPVYGRSNVNLSLGFNCECNESGKYQSLFSGEIIKDTIEVYLNFWQFYYNDNTSFWYERCWIKGDLSKTYKHEAQHIQNARSKADTLSLSVKKTPFSTKKECENNGKEEYRKLVKKWDEWYGNEQRHNNQNSPKYGGTRNEYICL